MITKDQVNEVIKNYILQLQDENKIDKCKKMLERIELLSENEFNKIVIRTLGENADINSFSNWLMKRLEEPELQGTKFIQINDFVSYNLAGTSKNTICLHVVPKQVSTGQIRSSGTYLVDALEKLKAKIKNGEFEEVETIFAVSDILKLKILQNYFRDLGFEIREGDAMFRGRFKNPYQASLSKDFLVSDEWEELKEKFMKDRPTIEDLEDKEK